MQESENNAYSNKRWKTRLDTLYKNENNSTKLSDVKLTTKKSREETKNNQTKLSTKKDIQNIQKSQTKEQHNNVDNNPNVMYNTVKSEEFNNGKV